MLILPHNLSFFSFTQLQGGAKVMQVGYTEVQNEI